MEQLRSLVNDPMVQKAALWIAVAVLVVLSYQYSGDPMMSAALFNLATFLSGGALVRRPGDAAPPSKPVE